jgi:hypothetical protein
VHALSDRACGPSRRWARRRCGRALSAFSRVWGTSGSV